MLVWCSSLQLTPQKPNCCCWISAMELLGVMTRQIFPLANIFPPSWDISDQGWYVGGKRGESSRNLFVQSTTRKTLAEDNFFQQKTHNLEIIICSADCAHSYAERKKTLQMKGIKFYYGINGKLQEDISSERGGRHLACWKAFLYYFKGAAKNIEKICKGNWRLTLTCNIHSQRK